MGNLFLRLFRSLGRLVRNVWADIGYGMTYEKDSVALATGAVGLIFSFIGVGIVFSIVSLFFTLGAVRSRHADPVRVIIAMLMGFAGVFISIYCIVYIFIYLSLGSSELLRKLI